MRPVKLCACGSGQERYDLTDAAGIFCTYVCEACEAEKRKGYSPHIFDQGNSYALTGDEADIDVGEPDNTTPLNLTHRELATVLAALRYWQDEGLQARRLELELLASHDGQVEPLTPAEIDALCERIN